MMPPARYARLSAMTWNTGPRAFGSACLISTVRSGSRLSLATYGATAITRVAVGRTRKLRWSQGRDPGGIVLIEGRTLGNTVVANKITRAIATTNSGTA